MVDMREEFEALREFHDEKRRSRKEQALERYDEIKSLVDKLDIDQNEVWNFSKGAIKGQFYPTKGSWQANGKMHFNGLESFIGFLRKR